MVYGIHKLTYRPVCVREFLSRGAILVGDETNGASQEPTNRQAFLFQRAEDAYESRPAPLFQPLRIVLAKGSNTTSRRRRLAERICWAYPKAEVVKAFDVPHNRVYLEEADLLRLHLQGKKTLVLAEHNSPVRRSGEEGNSCPNYWHFAHYGFCP